MSELPKADFQAFLTFSRQNKDLFLYNDSTYLFHIAKSIMTLQTLYGIIPNIYGKGKYAKMVADQIIRMRKELTQNQEPQVNSKIDNLIIIDRTMDYVTPMMIQLTYEGLVDENFNIKYSKSGGRLPWLRNFYKY